VITLRQLKYFGALARHGHFGRAASECAVSQPALSMQIRDLEKTLGVDLVERRPGEAVLTAIGRDLALRSEEVLAGARVNAMKLEAFKYYYAPAGAVGVAGICAKPTPEILKLQADIIAAVKAFTVETGPIGAFTAGHDDPATDAAIIQYVSAFVPKMSGANFNPHVSTGVAPKEYLDKMLAEPFESFTFSPAGAAVYQLGPFGTAAKKLKGWD